MDEEDIPRIVFFAVSGILVFFVLQAMFFMNYVKVGYLLFLGVFGYLFFFITKDYLIKKRDLENDLMIKDIDKIRINFWS